MPRQRIINNQKYSFFATCATDLGMVSDRIKSEKTGESGMNNQLYQPLYSISKKNVRNQSLEKGFVNKSNLKQSPKSTSFCRHYKVHLY